MSRRHRRRKPSEFQKIIAIIFLICIVLSAVGVSLNPGLLLGVVIFVLVIALIGVFLSTPIMRGKIGELKISLLLKSITKKNNGKVINDVIILDENNKSSQIELETARNLYFDSLKEYVVAEYDYNSALIALERTMHKHIIDYHDDAEHAINHHSQNVGGALGRMIYCNKKHK